MNNLALGRIGSLCRDIARTSARIASEERARERFAPPSRPLDTGYFTFSPNKVLKERMVGLFELTYGGSLSLKPIAIECGEMAEERLRMRYKGIVESHLTSKVVLLDLGNPELLETNITEPLLHGFRLK